MAGLLDASENFMNTFPNGSFYLCRDHVATITALEFLHRFYAEYSMVTNDRFLISLACLYLAGKVADSPKSSRDIILSGLSCVESSKEAFLEKVRSREWVDAARQQLTKAERAILYQTGFRFSKMTVTEAVLHMLQDKPLLPFLRSTFTDEEKLSNFSQLCIHFSNQSAKIPLVVQYKAETIAGACIWMTLKLFKVDDTSLRDPRPWYCKYKITHDALRGTKCFLTPIFMVMVFFLLVTF